MTGFLLFALLVLGATAVAVRMGKHSEKIRFRLVEMPTFPPMMPCEDPSPKRKKSERGERITDPLLRYKRRYGLCGQFSRMTRKSRHERAKRALEDAIRKQDLNRLEILHSIGIR